MLAGKAKIIIASIIASIAVVLAVGGLWWVNNGQEVFARLEQTLVKEASEAIGTKVTVGQLKLAGLTTAVIHNIVVFSDDGEIMASIEEVSASLSLFSFLKDMEPITMLRQVELKNPRLFLRQADNNRWNIEDLKLKETESSADFTGKIVISGGEVGVSTPLGEWQVRNIAGQADCAKWPETKVKLTFTHLEGGSEAKSQAEGTVNTKTGQMSLLAKVPQVYLPNYQKLIPDDIPIIFNDGKIIDIEADFQKDKEKMTYKGQFKIDDAKAKVSAAEFIDGLDAINIDKVRAWVTFDQNSINILEALAEAASQQITAKGKIGISGEKPALDTLDMVVESPGADLSAIFTKEIVPVEGAVAFRALFGGSFKEPVVEAQLGLDKGRYEKIAFANAKADLSYRGGVLAVQKAAAETFGGKIDLDGEINLQDEKYSLHLAGRDINMTEASNQIGFEEIDGSAQTVLTAKGSLKDLKNSEIDGQVSISAGKFAGVPFKNFYGAVTGTGELLSVRQAGVVLEDLGFINAAGEIRDGNLDLNLEGEQIQSGLLPFAIINDHKISGTISFNGKLIGDIAYPEADIAFKIGNCWAQGANYGDARGNLKITKDNIVIDEVTIMDTTGSHVLNGNIAFTAGGTQINLTAATSGIRAETVAALIGPEYKLTGYLDQETTITGSPDNLSAKGWIKLSAGSYDGYLIDEATSDYEYKDKVLYFDTLTVRSLGSKITAVGSLSADNKLNFSLQAREINLARMPVVYPYAVTGWINIDGQVKGTLADPVVTGKITASRIRANGQILTGLAGDFNYRGDVVHITQLSVQNGPGQVYFTGDANVKTTELNGRMTVENAMVQGLLELANQPKLDIAGFLNGNISLSGTFDKPSITLRGEIKDGRVRQYELGEVEMDASFINNVIKIKTLRAEQADGILVAQGEADLNGDINLEVSGQNLNAGLFTTFLDTSFNPPGKVTFTVQASGRFADPHVAASLEINSYAEEVAEFDNVYGLFTVSGGAVNIDHLLIEKGPYKASAQGVLPLKALNADGRSQAENTDAMDIKIKLDNFNLSILPLLFKEVTSASGDADGYIALTGTLATPQINGQISVPNDAGIVKLANFADPIEKIGVDIIFKDDTISIDKFSGQMRGGSYSLTGTAAVKGLGLTDYNLSLVVDKLRVRHKYFDGLLNAGLSLSNKGTGGRPLLAGSVSTENSIIDIPGVPEGGSTDLNVELDVEANIGRKVRLYNPYLFDLMVDGKVKIGGTMANMRLSGRVESRKGSITYLTTRFNVINASADFVPHQGLIPTVNLSTKARAGRTLVLLDVNGPADSLKLKLASDPPMSNENIIKMLTLGYDASAAEQSGGGSQTSNFWTIGLQMQAAARVEGMLRSSVGIDEFRIESASMFEYRNRKVKNNTDSEYYGYSLKIGKYLTDNIMLSYSIPLDQSSGGVTVQYDVNRRVTLTGTFGGVNNGLYTIESRFRF